MTFANSLTKNPNMDKKVKWVKDLYDVCTSCNKRAWLCWYTEDDVVCEECFKILTSTEKPKTTPPS
jgi:hypothetical protein